MTTSRPPAGSTASALHGQRSDPGLGLVSAGSPVLFEDWARTGTATTDYGENAWRRNTVGSGVASVVLQAPASDDAMGIVRIFTSTSGRGATLDGGSTTVLYQPPVGMVWATKVALSTTSSMAVWSGMANSTTQLPNTASAARFLGVRFDAAGAGTWEGVVKNGSGTSESTVTLAAAAAYPTWLRAGWECVDVDGAGTKGIQFFTLNLDSRQQLYRTNVGDPITANLPTYVGLLALGMQITAQGTRSAYSDWYCYGGRVAR